LNYGPKTHPIKTVGDATDSVNDILSISNFAQIYLLFKTMCVTIYKLST